jgi:glycosyltransferase involved in cell wall biosynthesis
MPDTPTISAVIPVHNGANYVADAIHSVLGQSHLPIECLVIDDGSTDATPEVVRGFGGEVTYVHQNQQGVSVARNRGAQLARGDLIAFLDHDDIWLPSKLARQVQALQHEGAALAMCALDVIDEHGSSLRTQRLGAREELLSAMLTLDFNKVVACPSAGLMRRQEFLRMGGFDPALSISQDWDLLLRTLLGGDVAYVDEPLVRYRVHGANKTRERNAVATLEHDMAIVFAKAFAEPRLPAALSGRKGHSYACLYRRLGIMYLSGGDQLAAVRSLANSVRNDPTVILQAMRRGLRQSRWLPFHRRQFAALPPREVGNSGDADLSQR